MVRSFAVFGIGVSTPTLPGYCRPDVPAPPRDTTGPGRTGGIRLENCQGVRIENCRIVGTDVGISMSEGTTVSSKRNEFINVRQPIEITREGKSRPKPNDKL